MTVSAASTSLECESSTPNAPAFTATLLFGIGPRSNWMFAVGDALYAAAAAPGMEWMESGGDTSVLRMPLTGTPTWTVIAGYSSPLSRIAVDGSNNVYVYESPVATIWRVFSAGSVTSRVSPTFLASSSARLSGLAAASDGTIALLMEYQFCSVFYQGSAYCQSSSLSQSLYLAPPSGAPTLAATFTSTTVSPSTKIITLSASMLGSMCSSRPQLSLPLELKRATS
jgi:hypothetical protein